MERGSRNWCDTWSVNEEVEGGGVERRWAWRKEVETDVTPGAWTRRWREEVKRGSRNRCDVWSVNEEAEEGGEERRWAWREEAETDVMPGAWTCVCSVSVCPQFEDLDSTQKFVLVIKVWSVSGNVLKVSTDDITAWTQSRISRRVCVSWLRAHWTVVLNQNQIGQQVCLFGFRNATFVRLDSNKPRLCFPTVKVFS